MRKYKVVIIDDELWTREVVKSLGQWDDMGLEVVGEAADGEYGLELIRHTVPDIIITDVRMPQLNGMELIQTLRKEGNETLVIFISGHDDYLYVRSALKLDVIDYLLKPIKQEELNKQLQNCTKLLSEKDEYRSVDEKLTGGFLDVSWAGKYYVLRDALYDSLSSGNPKLIQNRFCAIQQLIENNDEKNLSKGSMICIYYTLMNALHRFIFSRDYLPEEVLGSEETTFVFNSGNTLERMLNFISNLYCTTSTTMQELIRTRNKLDIKKIRKYVEVHYSEGITLEETAAIFYVSKEYLSKAFKTNVGMGFSEFVTSLRMEKAKELIQEYKIPIKEVSGLVGYVDQSHFYKTFKKFYGKTPGEIRDV